MAGGGEDIPGCHGQIFSDSCDLLQNDVNCRKNLFRQKVSAPLLSYVDHCEILSSRKVKPVSAVRALDWKIVFDCLHLPGKLRLISGVGLFICSSNK